MNHNHSVFSLLLIFALSCNLWAENVNHFISSGLLRVEKTWQGAEPVFLEFESFSLKADSGVLLHDLSVSLTLLPSSEISSMPSNMVNVTGDFVGAYRLLPNGTHFSEPAIITIPYGALPLGYSPSDIYTFYYDDDIAQWKQLERVAVDTIARTISSYTTHFTDFANAVIKVPEMPESTAFVPTAMTDLPDVNPLQGIPMITAPQANNRGTAELSYPIEIPKGRNGLQPNIDLHYSSAGGNGILGVGWSIQTPAITIDTRWGVPRYSPDFETEAYLVNGEQVVFYDDDNTPIDLPHQSSNFIERIKRPIVLHARDRKNQDRIVRHGTNPNDYWWSVTDRNGTTTYYGCNYDVFNPRNSTIDPNSVIKTAEGQIAYWAATLVVDKDGNSIIFNNSVRDNTIYVQGISYTANFKNNIDPSYRILFAYEDRPDISSNGRLGILQYDKERLCHILVQYLHHGEDELSENLAAYFMEYGDVNASSLFKSRLAAVVKLDSVPDLCLDDVCSLNDVLYGDVKYNESLVKYLFEYDKRYREACREKHQHAFGGVYGLDSIPGSRTIFEYFDAKDVSDLFGGDTIELGEGVINRTATTSWNTGGYGTIGPGGDVITSFVSAGTNFSFGTSTSKVKEMLIDLNGDGLPDRIFANNNKVYYQKMMCGIGQNSFYLSPNAILLEGINNITKDISVSGSWGLQASLGHNIAYSMPISNTYTTEYFADMNGDGLPDYVKNGTIMVNVLRGGIPTFVPTEDGVALVTNNSPACRVVTRTGAIDEHLECYLREELVDSIPLSVYYPEVDDPYLVDEDEIMDDLEPESESRPLDDIDSPYDPNADILIRENSRRSSAKRVASESDNELPGVTSDSSLICRIVGNYVYRYRLDTICLDDQMDPDIEAVRVWVAPFDGEISLSSKITLIEDFSASRQASYTVDGVRYVIQKSSIGDRSDIGRNISYPEYRLHSDTTCLLHVNSILKDYYEPQFWSSNVNVKTGDVLFFHLRSNDNHLYDNTNWEINIAYLNDTIVGKDKMYSSAEDYLCFGLKHFQARGNGEAIVDISYSNQNDSLLVLDIVKSDSLFTFDSIQQSISMASGGEDTLRFRFSLDSGYRLLFKVHKPLHDDVIWSRVKVSAKVTYIADFNADAYLDTIYVYPDVQLPADSMPGLDSVYHQLFGSLHRGWGQFAYNNILASDTIVVDSLYNNRLVSMADGDYSNANFIVTGIDTTNVENAGDQLTARMAQMHLYNALDSSCYWVAMESDCQTNRWIAIGNMASIGQYEHSNAKVSQIESELVVEEDTVVLCDSYYPLVPNSSTKAINKHSLSIQHSLSWGSMGIFNASNTWGHFLSKSDMMDMNGDGLPDILGVDGIQYTRPWGGIEKLKKVPSFGMYSSRSTVEGTSFSASPGFLSKITGRNTRNGIFAMFGGFGSSKSTGNSHDEEFYTDVNGDGLPDIVNTGDTTVRYNLGYKFMDRVKLDNPTLLGNKGKNENNNQNASSPSFDIAQASISGGMDYSSAANYTIRQLLDINGDGLVDAIYDNGGNTFVDLNTGNGHQLMSSAMINDSSSVTHSETSGVNASGSGGFTVVFFRINVGASLSVGTEGKSVTKSSFMDVNGDGLPDYVYTKNDVLMAILNQGGKSNLLKTVINPTGHRLEIDYTLSPVSVSHRGRQWEMTNLVDVDTINPIVENQMGLSTYEYINAYYDNLEKTDYGYRRVVSTINSEKILEETYDNRYFIKKGEKISDKLLDIEKKPYIGHRIGKGYFRPGVGKVVDDDLCYDASINELSEGYWTDYYNGEEEPLITIYHNIVYDDLHNMIQYGDSGDIAVSGDEWTQEITYLPNSVRNLISLPKSELVVSAGRTLRESLINYDREGHPTQIIMDDRQRNLRAMTSLEYDDVGNVTRITYPENDNRERAYTDVKYDNEVYSYPVSVSNQFGMQTSTQYDFRWGLPLQTTDPAGVYMDYAYDYMGRLSVVRAPAEAVNQAPYTIRYSYNNVNHNLLSPLSHSNSTVIYTSVLKEINDSLGDNSKELTLFDNRGTPLQKKSYQSVLGNPQWVVAEHVVTDLFGRKRVMAYPAISTTSDIEDYEPIAGMFVSSDYDVLDRPLYVLNPDGSDRLMTYSFMNDRNGHLRMAATTIDEERNSSTLLQSPQEWTIEQINADSTSTYFEYNPIGELSHVVDPDGYETTYDYDMFGHCIRRVHPDAGTSIWQYDAAGNLISSSTSNLLQQGKNIQYEYSFNRLKAIHYPFHHENDVLYFYDQAGRVFYRMDGAGSDSLTYDALGNVSSSTRRIVCPLETNSYTFTTRYSFDSFGRMRQLVYPDGEVVDYKYTTGGLLDAVIGAKSGNNIAYISNRKYDEAGRKVYQRVGNGTESTYKYDRARNWLTSLITNTPLENLQDLSYQYDAVGNITSIRQAVGTTAKGLGGQYYNTYLYDNRYRLTDSYCRQSPFDYDFSAEYSPSGELRHKFCMTQNSKQDAFYGYDMKRHSHQPRVTFDNVSGSQLQLFWDASGNMVQAENCKMGVGRLHIWDEENRLRLMTSEKRCGYYGYDADGKRVYKLLGTNSDSQMNGGPTKMSLVFDDVVLYPSPYMTITKQGYTKHYYAGSERIASAIGSGGLDDMSVRCIGKLHTRHDSLIMSSFFNQWAQKELFEPIDNESFTKNVGGDNTDSDEFQYQCEPISVVWVDAAWNLNILGPVISKLSQDLGPQKDVFYYHGDHLGSASWITDVSGMPIQYVHYAPYGEFVDNQHPYGYDERYKFTGKERDEESGYDYVEARYYSSLLGIWLSVDPLVDKYLWITPYAYTLNNPVKYIDPDGRIVVFAKGTTLQQKQMFYQAVRYLNSHNCGGRYGQLLHSRHTFQINMNTSKTNSKRKTGSIFTINWNPTAAIEVDGKVVMSPASALNHEMAHATKYDDALTKFEEDVQTLGFQEANETYNEYLKQSVPDDTNPYGNKEDESIIKGIEQRTALLTGEIQEGEVTRTHHGGTLVQVEGPTSTKKIE